MENSTKNIRPPRTAHRRWLSRLVGRLPGVRELIAENDRLHKDLDDLASNRTTLHELAVRNGTITAAMGTETARIIADSFAELLREHGAKNYLEMQFHSPKVPGETLCMTLRWHDGKTPDQLKCEAEAKLAALSSANVQAEPRGQ